MPRKKTVKPKAKEPEEHIAPEPRAEGEEFKPGIIHGDAEDLAEWTVADSPSLEANDAHALARIAESFRAQHPESWEGIATCPTNAGIDEMIKVLKG